MPEPDIVNPASGASPAASSVTTDTSNFDDILSALDTTAQKALDTLDDHTHSESVSFNVYDNDVDVAVADGKVAWNVPAIYNGWEVTAVVASVYAKGITGTTDVMVRRSRTGTDEDVLSAPITIGDEYFAADGTIDTDYDDLATGDMFFIDVDDVHSGTAPKGLFVSFTITKP
jgi:hypothetical protein